MSRGRPTSTEPDSKSLQGRRIGLALAADVTYSPATVLAALGAAIVHYPCQEMLPLDDPSELDQAVQELAKGQYHGLLLTTPDALKALLMRLDNAKLQRDALDQLLIAAYGADTQLSALAELGERVIRLPNTPSHADVVAALDPVKGSRYMLPIPAARAPDWPAYFAAHDAHVTVVPAYRAHMRRDGEDLPGMLWAGSLDAMVFVSADNLRYFATRLRQDGGTLAMLDDVPVVCMDEATAAAAIGYGLRTILVTEESANEAVAATLQAYFATHPER